MQRRYRLLALALILGLLCALDGAAQVTVSGSGSTKVVPNDPTTGTVLNGLAKVGPTGAIRSTPGDTTSPLWIVVGGNGTSSNVPAVLAVSGDVPCLMDATATNVRGYFVVQSPTANNQCHAQATAPSTGYAVGFMSDNATTTGQTALVSAQLVNFQPGSGTGTGSVTSVGFTPPSLFSVSGAPITSAGTIVEAWQAQAANCVVAGPTTGANAQPTCRPLVAADIAGTGAITTCAGDLAGTSPSCNVAAAGGNSTSGFVWKGIVTATGLPGTVTDYTGCQSATICRLSSNSDVVMNSLNPVITNPDGRPLTLCNVGTTNKITLVNASASGTATMQFVARSNMTLQPKDCKRIWYDNTSQKWRPWDSALLDAYAIRTCDIPFGSMDPASPDETASDDVINTCLNNTGLDWVITAVSVWANAGSPAFLPVLNGLASPGPGDILTTTCSVTTPNQLIGCSMVSTPVIVKSLGTDGKTCPASSACGLNGNIDTVTTNFKYGYIHIVGRLQ